tara:strand:+ start:126 stop:536 length:411 start_codon:yes stop_codon:yes gene_type:complete
MVINRRKMKENKFIKSFSLYAFISFFLFHHCAQMTLTHIANLRMEMTVEETLDITSISPTYQFILDDINTPDEIEVHSYILSSGDYKSNYFLVFRNKKLFYWGYPHEFARKQDPFLNEIGKKAINRLDELEPIYKY